MKFSVQKLEAARQRLDSAEGCVESELMPYIQFDFFLQYQPSDGYVIVHTKECRNAPLDSCIKIIKNKGCLSYDDYRTLCV